jgi:hypothetical protein
VLIEVSAAGRRVPERSNSSARSNKRIGKRTAPMLVQKIVGGSGAKTAAPAPIRGVPGGSNALPGASEPARGTPLTHTCAEARADYQNSRHRDDNRRCF